VSVAGSVAHWIRRLEAGDQVAFQQLWEGYFRRLVGPARRRLQGRAEWKGRLIRDAWAKEVLP
jgi:hypothetical protein